MKRTKSWATSTSKIKSRRFTFSHATNFNADDRFLCYGIKNLSPQRAAYNQEKVIYQYQYNRKNYQKYIKYIKAFHSNNLLHYA